MLSVHRSAAARRTHARGRQARHGGRVAAVVKGSGRGVPISKIESTYLRAVEESALVVGASRGGLPRPWLLGTTTTGSRGAPLEGHRLAAAQVAAPVVAARRLHLVERHVGREHARDAQVDAAVLVERHARVARQPERVPKLKGRSGGAGGEQWSGERERRGNGRACGGAGGPGRRVIPRGGTAWAWRGRARAPGAPRARRGPTRAVPSAS